MVNDVLYVKSSITGYANVITEACNEEFRQTIQQMRDSDENASTTYLS